MPKLFFSVMLWLATSAALAQHVSSTDTSPPHAPEVSPVPSELIEYTLRNGMQVRMLVDESRPRVAMVLGYHVGSADDPAGYPQLAHVAEHLMFEGDAEGDAEYWRSIQRAGGSPIVGETHAEHTLYGAQVPANALQYALWVEARRSALVLATVGESHLQRSVRAVEDENRLRATSQILGHELARHLGFGRQDIETTSAEDLAPHPPSLDEVRGFIQRQYVPRNATLALVGDFDPDAAKTMVERAFGPFAGRTDTPSHDARAVATPAEPGSTEIRARVSQTFFGFGWRLPNTRTLSEAQAHVLARALDSSLTEQLERGVRTYVDVRAAGTILGVRSALDLESDEDAAYGAVERAVKDACTPEKLRNAIRTLQVDITTQRASFLTRARRLAMQRTPLDEMPGNDEASLEALASTCRAQLGRSPAEVWFKKRRLFGGVPDASERTIWR